MKTKKLTKTRIMGNLNWVKKLCLRATWPGDLVGTCAFGVLIATRETKTHCYARTHKGNIKTLTKGKDYWWMK